MQHFDFEQNSDLDGIENVNGSKYVPHDASPNGGSTYYLPTMTIPSNFFKICNQSILKVEYIMHAFRFEFRVCRAKFETVAFCQCCNNPIISFRIVNSPATSQFPVFFSIYL